MNNVVLEKPAGTGPWPGVVVLHDALGVSSDIKNITRRFADNGFLATAPSLFAGRSPAKCIRAVVREVVAQDNEAVGDILAARRTLAEHPDCSGKVGVVGFCLGGGFALLVAPKGFDAAAPFYPSVLPMYDTLVEGACPVVASFGARDPLNPGNAARLRKSLDRRGIENDIKVYPGVGHSFANVMPAQGLARIVGFGYNEEATDDAFARVFSFFRTHLEP
ncbi:dienelactone hydrolase family protein [Antrihabitans sp. YC2-6]|uniref:dienelactone hydrolase family protein n=1 Tax=Antrihabitans sp. YC2-6 TaxID=2799498 RepID=UPI0018F77149|nr:dienelactone hydrolase family protein [Antrihabitans sp. YC2-6]MBJ8347355.1 dienelactone hydrolase family protein [Antrihabitans sp. YC2-6]